MDGGKQIKNISDIPGIELIPPETIELIQAITREEMQEMFKEMPQALTQEEAQEMIGEMLGEMSEDDYRRYRSMYDKGNRKLEKRIQKDTDKSIDKHKDDMLNTYPIMYNNLQSLLDKWDHKNDGHMPPVDEQLLKQLLITSIGRAFCEQLSSKISELDNQD